MKFTLTILVDSNIVGSLTQNMGTSYILPYSSNAIYIDLLTNFIPDAANIQNALSSFKGFLVLSSELKQHDFKTDQHEGLSPNLVSQNSFLFLISSSGLIKHL